MLDEVRLANYIAGIDPGPIAVGRIDGLLADALKVHISRPVWLSDWTIKKTNYRHPDIDFRDYKQLPAIIANGFAIRGRSARIVELCYSETVGTETYFWKAVLKATAGGEVYLTMIHRYGREDARRIYRRAQRNANLLRDPQEQRARLGLSRARLM